ncbi:Alpha-L-arabinofuranosidase, C-terminal [Fimbriimonadaceae bacterium]
MLFLLLIQEPAQLSLDLRAPGVAVSPYLYGHMTEEINYSYDGGLYAELIRNRAFLDDRNKPAHWSPVEAGSTVTLERAGMSAARPVALKVTGGTTNDGYWGIPIRPATTYSLSVWAKAETAGPLRASLESVDGKTIFAEAVINGVGADWKNHTVKLKTAKGLKPTKDARFALRSGPGKTFMLSQVSLFPPTYRNRPNGNRPDLMKLLSDMKPKFLRFPGGNYLEGNTPADRFPWKETLGPIETRPGHRGTWGYRSSDGMGLLEFLLWCEETNAKPLLGVYAGYALNGEYTKAGPALEPFVQEALDEIEYIVGGPETKWGARRIADGHPKPFDLEWVEVGNEDGFDKSGSYESRFVQFYDAIKKKYPKMQVISSTGGKDFLGAKFPITQRRPDLWDEHYYSESWDMMGMATKYDTYDRKGPKVFVGEWAAHDTAAPWQAGPNAGPTPNMKCTIADAAFMTGMERNSDIVEMACYAPLLVNVNPGGRQWSLNLIGYDALESFGSPSYYAQTLFAQNLGNRTVELKLSGVPTQRKGTQTLPGIFASATRDTKSGVLYLKVVNALPGSQSIDIDLQGANLQPDGTWTYLTGYLKDMNSIAEPLKVAPITRKLTGLGSKFQQRVPGYSVNVFKLQTKR